VTASTDRLYDPRDRTARASRILDSAAELLLRYGYRRLTIEDVAERAGIGKGTVYLHWKSREELFRAVFEREVAGAIEELVAVLRQDEHAWRLHRLVRFYFLAIVSRPLLRAEFLSDPELLGKLTRPENSISGHRHALASSVYFELLSERGILRGELSPAAIAYASLATLEGFVRAEAGADGRSIPTVEERADLLAQTLERAFETGLELPAETERLVASQVVAVFASLGAPPAPTERSIRT
jgi:AcrR family transcriptional regulator